MKRGGACQTDTDNQEILTNILRNLTMLEKAFGRLKRKNWHHESQYPEIIFEIETLLLEIRAWINSHREFSGVPSFVWQLGVCVFRIGPLIADLVTECAPAKGKKREKKPRSEREKANILNSLGSMAKNMAARAGSLKPSDTPVGTEIENALRISFEQHLSSANVSKNRAVSKRGGKTCVFPCSDADWYDVLVNDRKNSGMLW